MQTPWNHTPDTMDTTKRYGYCRHHEIIHQTLCMLPGTWTSSALQTPGNHTEFTMDTSRHSIHQEAIHKNLYTPQATMDSLHSAVSRQLYNGYNEFHKYPWTMQTPENHTTDNMHNTRHNGHHGQWIKEGTLQQTLWTPPCTVDTMVSVSVSVSINVSVCVSV